MDAQTLNAVRILTQTLGKPDVVLVPPPRDVENGRRNDDLTNTLYDQTSHTTIAKSLNMKANWGHVIAFLLNNADDLLRIAEVAVAANVDTYGANTHPVNTSTGNAMSPRADKLSFTDLDLEPILNKYNLTHEDKARVYALLRGETV